MKNALLTAVVALVWACAAIAPASAGTSAMSIVTLNVSKAPTFRGTVSSTKGPCRASRRVVVEAFGPEGRYKFGADTTNAKGKWQFSEQLDGATTFQASVKARRANGVLCKSASSDIERVSFQG